MFICSQQYGYITVALLYLCACKRVSVSCPIGLLNYLCISFASTPDTHFITLCARSLHTQRRKRKYIRFTNFETSNLVLVNFRNFSLIKLFVSMNFC